MDKTAEEFRKVHAERQNLLEQWENTIEQMQKRDREMDQLAVVRDNQTSPSKLQQCNNSYYTYNLNLLFFASLSVSGASCMKLLTAF